MFSEATGARHAHVVLADVQPLGVLVEHGIDDVGEGLIGVEEPVAPGEQIPLEPAEQGVLGQHLHDAAIARELAAVGVLRQQVGHPGLLAHLVDGLEPVRGGLVRAEDAEASSCCSASRRAGTRRAAWCSRAAPCHAQAPRRRSARKSGSLSSLRSSPPLACGLALMRRRPLGRQRLELGHERSARIEQLLGPVAAHPVFEDLQVRRVVPHVGERDLVRAPGPFQLVALELLRSGPPLGRAQHDHRPARTRGLVRVACRLLMRRGSRRSLAPAWRPSSGASRSGSLPSTK